MKKFCYFFCCIISFFAAFSCSKSEVETGTVQTVGKLSLNVSGSPVSKSILKNGSEVWWTSSDKLQVFDETGTAHEFTNSLTEPAASAVFTCESWPAGVAPKYAAAFNDNHYYDAAVCDVESGIISAKIGYKQSVAYASSFARTANASVGIVEGEEGAYVISEMKNISGLLAVSFSGSNAIKSITVHAIGGEPLSGWVDVDYAKLIAGEEKFWTPTSNKEILPDMTLVPYGDRAEEDKSFKTDCEYYIPILPQTYSKGLRFVMTDTEGKVFVRTVGSVSGFSISRNAIQPFTVAFDEGASFASAEQPDSLVFRLGGEEWRLSPSVAKTQTTEGETYQYNYYDYSTGYAAQYEFRICKGDGDPYSYVPSDQALKFKANSAWVLLPAIEGYTIKSLALAHMNTASKNFSLYEGAYSVDVGKALITKTGIDVGRTFEKTFYSDDEVTPSENTPTYLKILSASSFYRNITVVYAKELPKKPLAPIVIKFNSGSIKGLTSTSAEDNTAFTVSGYNFIAVNGGWKYSGALYNATASNGKIQFPAIEKYRLVSVSVANGNTDGKTYSVRDSSGKNPETGSEGAQKLIKSDGYTWEFESTKANTSYFLWSHNKNAKTTKLELTYNPVEE